MFCINRALLECWTVPHPHGRPSCPSCPTLRPFWSGPPTTPWWAAPHCGTSTWRPPPLTPQTLAACPRSRAASAPRVTPGPRVNSVPLGTSSRKMEWGDAVLGVAVTTTPTPVTPAPACVWWVLPKECPWRCHTLIITTSINLFRRNGC